MVFAKTVEQSTWISTLGFLQKSEEVKKLEKQCFCNKSLIGNIVVLTTKWNIRKLKGAVGESGYRTRYLPHAKRALYHLSWIPRNTFLIPKLWLQLF